MSTQRQRLGQARVRLMALYPQLVEIRDEMVAALGDAQNDPPEGRSDGTVPAHKYAEYREIERGLRSTLLGLLFDKEWTPAPAPDNTGDHCLCEMYGGTYPNGRIPF